VGFRQSQQAVHYGGRSLAIAHTPCGASTYRDGKVRMTRAPYSQEISRQNKALFLFLLDQSFSMEEPLGNSAIASATS